MFDFVDGDVCMASTIDFSPSSCVSLDERWLICMLNDIYCFLIQGTRLCTNIFSAVTFVVHHGSGDSGI